MTPSDKQTIINFLRKIEIYNFTCKAGSLENCSDYRDLLKFLEPPYLELELPMTGTSIRLYKPGDLKPSEINIPQSRIIYIGGVEAYFKNALIYDLIKSEFGEYVEVIVIKDK